MSSNLLVRSDLRERVHHAPPKGMRCTVRSANIRKVLPARVLGLSGFGITLVCEQGLHPGDAVLAEVGLGAFRLGRLSFVRRVWSLPSGHTVLRAEFAVSLGNDLLGAVLHADGPAPTASMAAVPTPD